MTEQSPAGWHPHPLGRHELRYWNGGQWSEHVSTSGRQAIDPPVQPQPRAAGKHGRKVTKQLRKLGVSASAQPGGGTLFTEPVLVFNQNAKLLEVNAEYTIYSQGGTEVGSVREVGRTFMSKTSGPTRNRQSHTFEVVDTHGKVLFRLNRPAKILRSKMSVFGEDGEAIGESAQKALGGAGCWRFGTKFTREAHGHPVGSMISDGQEGWECVIHDPAGNQVAQITRSWAGMTKEVFTKADNYVLQFRRPLEEPLRSLVIAGAVALDTAFRQK